MQQAAMYNGQQKLNLHGVIYYKTTCSNDCCLNTSLLNNTRLYH